MDVVDTAHPFDRSPMATWRAAIVAWLFALLILGAVIGLIVHFSELHALAMVVRHMRRVWLFGAVALQGLTYVCAAAVWQLALTHEGFSFRVRTLVPMALAMLFANQAFPSAGLAGSAVVMRSLRRREVPPHVVMGALLVGLITMYAAYLLALVMGLAILGAQVERGRLLIVLALFALAAAGIPTAISWYRHSLPARARTAIARVPGIGALLDAMAAAPGGLLKDRRLLLSAAGIQFLEILLDAATLFVVVVAIDAPIPPSVVFACFAVASAAARVVPVPLGLGSFEGALTGILHLAGVPLEAALTATLLLRGLTLWLPMLPGLWCARHELWGGTIEPTAAAAH
ncbi:MAG TPA: lysylphosphatidylglycerol synthase transmembrane domain-containing protein [Vicinamibacterales bacterium]